MAKSTVPDSGPLLLTVAAAGALLSLPRSSAYHLVATGEIPSVMVGSRIRVSQRALEAYVARLEQDQAERDERLRRVARGLRRVR